MDWIHSHRGIINHPKTKRLARTLNINRAHAIGILHALWYHAVDIADGDTLNIDWDDLAEECFWDGDATELVEALVDAQWLHRTDGRALRLHDWWEYGGRTVIAKQSAKLAGLKGAHARYHKTVKDPSCAWCYPQSTETDTTRPTEAKSAPSDVPAPSGNPENTPDSSPPIGSAIAERVEREEKKEHTHPLGTQQATPAHRLACVWFNTGNPSRSQLTQATRALTAVPDIATLNPRRLEALTRWAKTGGTRTVGGLGHVAASWPDWPKTTRPRPPWCGDPDCEQTTRLRFDDDGTAQPCPNCSTPPEARAS